MSNAVVFLAEGFEEIEAITVIDYLRRAGVSVATVAVPAEGKAGGTVVVAAHGVPVVADTSIGEYVDSGAPLPDCVFAPGGMPGAANLAADIRVLDLIKKCFDAKKLVAAICAAPVVVLARTGILAGREYTCYPGMEKSLGEYCGGDARAKELTQGSSLVALAPFVTSGNVVTGRGPGCAEQFAMELTRILAGEKTAAMVKSSSVQR